MPVVLNGGIKQVQQALEALEWADGVMIGREAYHRPTVLGEIFIALDSDQGYRPPSVTKQLERMAEYAEREMTKGERLTAITRHLLGLVSHSPGAREYRRLLSEGARERGAGPGLIMKACQFVPGEAL